MSDLADRGAAVARDRDNTIPPAILAELMKSRWTDEAKRQAVALWGREHGQGLAIRIYTARLIGHDSDLVLHGGGNASIKARARNILGDEFDVVHVKASGCDMAAIEPHGLPALELAPLLRLRSLASLDDDEMVRQLRRCLLNPADSTPSIEGLLHAFLPHRFVDHSHADAVICLTNQPNPEPLIREALQDRVALLPYIRPGFDLAKAVAVADAAERHPNVEGIVLIQHGLITFGDDAQTSYERHIAIVDACERFIENRLRGRTVTVSFRSGGDPTAAAARVAPLLRGLIAHPTGDADRPFVRSILEWRGGNPTLSITNSPEARRIADSGPLTADHLIRTKARPLFIEEPAWSDPPRLRRQLGEAAAAYRKEYAAYVQTHGRSPDGVDTAPRVVMLPGAGLFCWGSTKRDAIIAADIAEHTLATKAKAESLGEYVSLSDDHLFDMEFRGLQVAKLRGRDDAPLAGQVVVISGGAGAVGSAIAEVCAEAGAHVVITDLDEARMRPVVERIERKSGAGTARAVVMDVTDEAAVRDGFAEICRAYGGVDVIVPNAGAAHVAPIADLQLNDFRRVLEINATGYFLFMREGARILKEQGLGGNIVAISSKNVLAPGKDFGAYSASKAAGHQLAKVAALELAQHNIRVNMIAPDAIFGDAATPSGLWQTVGPDRAKSRNLPPAELPGFYRDRTLLKAAVTGRHVGNAVVFFAGNQTPTTGATLPVDAGLPEAFPR